MKEALLRQWGRSDPHNETDARLVERSRQGDHDAFGELVRRHRPKAHGWASRMTLDPYMADDIVQEALLLAFMHLSSLVDIGRFVPWLHRIVRNQAMMKLRRGGPYRNERPFTSLVTVIRPDQVEWEITENMLAGMTRDTSDPSIHGNPEQYVLRKETLETVIGLFGCLSRRERAIFEAYYFKHLSPREIARMFDTSTASIYKTISRTRQKLKLERIRVYRASI
ncbi:RNA polymerase sigma factor [Paenibacillus mesophilus]|uniref:RNA polymerase sigma factor n=1 Tax=Paenibacillus mesophilus TaxID=2582849 RepID=UPI00130545EA|nr:RNA polymerase sigma factor [Paenibacillus mesophilus]